MAAAAPVSGAVWIITDVDDGGGNISGTCPCLALDSSGSPRIIYYNNTGDLTEYASWDGSSWHIEKISNTHDLIPESLALDSSGRPWISINDFNLGVLKYAWHDGSSWHTGIVDNTGGAASSIALNSSDKPRISYYDGDLKYASWDGSSWHIETVDSAGDVGAYSSLALDSSDNPHISYCDETNADLKYAWYDGSSWNNITIDNAGNGYTSLALDSSGNPRISYYNGGLKYAWRDGSSWINITVDSGSGNNAYKETSLALDSSGNPHISYYDETNADLKYASWDGSSWHTGTVDSAGDVGAYSSLALDSSGNPRISYYDETDATLKYAAFQPDPAPLLTTSATSRSSSGSAGSNTDTGIGVAEDLKAGESASFTMSRGAVYRVEITAGTDLEKVMITVQRKDSLPSSADPPEGDVYEYEDVKIYYAENSALSGGTFYFKVSKSWLSSHGYGKGDIVMMHYNEDSGEWEELPTTLIDEDGTYYYYSADTSSFSLFAIAISEGATIIPEEKATPAAMDVSTPEETAVYNAKPVSSETPAAVSSFKEESPWPALLILAAAIVLILIVLAGIAGRRKTDKYPEWWDHDKK